MHTSTGKYTERITERLFVSGFEVEQYKYLDKPIVRNYKRKKRQERQENQVSENEKKKPREQTEKTDFAVRRTRKEIRRLVNSNPQLNKFLTLTTTEINVAKANKHFNLFTQRMNAHYPEFQYLAVSEFQKDIDFFGKVKPNGGAVHYHLLCNLRYVVHDKLAKIWHKDWFIKIKRVSHVDNLGRYLAKYLQKDMFDKRMFGKKKFFCSQNLKRSIEITNDDAQNYMQDNAENLKLVWKPEKPFDDEYRGKIEYTVFNLKNKHT